MAISTDTKHQQTQQQQKVHKTEQQTASVAKSGQIVRSQRSSQRRQQEAQAKHHKEQHDRHERALKHKQEEQLEARDNRLAINRQNAAVRSNQIQNNAQQQDGVDGPGGPAAAAQQALAGRAGRQTNANAPKLGSLARSALDAGLTSPSEDTVIDSPVASVVSAAATQDRTANKTPDTVPSVDVGATTSVDAVVEQVLNLADLSSTPQKFGGAIARENASREQIDQFVAFLTSAFQKKDQEVDEVERQFSILRWALMLEAVGEAAQKYILEAASAAGFDADTIREMVENAVRVLEEKDVADSDFVAMLDDELDAALDESKGPEFEEDDDGDVYKFKLPEEKKLNGSPRRKVA